MLDLLITYINFLILSISYIVKKFSFLPPNPPKYIIVKGKEKEEQKEEIFFLMKTKKGNFEYRKLRPKFLNIKYDKIKNENFSLPILIITPENHLPICMIYCQGNSGDLATSLFECFESSIRCKSIIVTFEYPGYGICKNDEISESEFFKRMEIVYSFVTNELKYKPNQIILYGFSLGTGIAFDFACKKKYPVAGLILQSPFLSIIRTIYNIKQTTYFDLFNNCDKAKNLCTKTLFLHGNKDKIVPYIHGRILAELIPKEYFYDFITVNNADHNNLLKENKLYVYDYINKFITDCINNYKVNEINDDMTDTDNGRRISSFNYLTKSENIRFNRNEKHKYQSLFRNKMNLKVKNIIPNSYANHPIIKRLDKENNNVFQKIRNEDTNYNQKISLYKKYNFKDKNNENQILNNVLQHNQKIINLSKNNYYYINIGTNRLLEKYENYKRYQKEKKDNIMRILRGENSMASINQLANNNSINMNQ